VNNNAKLTNTEQKKYKRRKGYFYSGKDNTTYYWCIKARDYRVWWDYDKKEGKSPFHAKA
jgi:hypothetical protein